MLRLCLKGTYYANIQLHVFITGVRFVTPQVTRGEPLSETSPPVSLRTALMFSNWLPLAWLPQTKPICIDTDICFYLLLKYYVGRCLM